MTTEIAADPSSPIEEIALDAIAVKMDQVQEVETEAEITECGSSTMYGSTPKRSFTHGKFSSKDWIIDRGT